MTQKKRITITLSDEAYDYLMKVKEGPFIKCSKSKYIDNLLLAHKNLFTPIKEKNGLVNS